MAGHSKWATIKRAKGAQDAKRGKLFNKVSREIMTAARIGGNNPDSNPRLRKAIQLAKSVSMPKDNISKILNKKEKEQYDEVTYEGYAPGGVALMVKCLTDNKARTVAKIRHIFNKAGGNLGESGCVKYLFDKKGEIVVETASDKFKELAIELGAQDITEEEGFTIVSVKPNDHEEIYKQVVEHGYEPVSSKIIEVPNAPVTVEKEMKEKVLKIINQLEDLDDVQNIYTNMQN